MGFAFVRKEQHLIAYNFDQYQTEWTLWVLTNLTHLVHFF
jgi:hypothetical protein